MHSVVLLLEHSADLNALADDGQVQYIIHCTYYAHTLNTLCSYTYVLDSSSSSSRSSVCV
jgi:hypothetical protein